MVSAANQPPKFPWDIDIPPTDFWKDVNEQIARAFIQCFTNAEMSHMTLDASLAKDEKLRVLRGILNRKLAAPDPEGGPLSPSNSNHDTWISLNMAIVSVDTELGDYDAAEKALLDVKARSKIGPEGKQDLNAEYALGWFYMQTRRYAEAEPLARETLAWVQGLPKLGHDSPQALGCMRSLVVSTWKQGRQAESQEWVEKCRDMIEKLHRTPFAKYVDEEREELDSVVNSLKE